MEGIDIHYLSIGEGKTIVFLHGWGGSTDSFLGVARQLSTKYRCILVDFAGFGESPEPSKPYRLIDFTNDLDTLLDRLNIKECFFVAHSFGGRVAIDFVTNKRKCHIQGMVLTDSAGMKPHRGIRYYIKILRYKLRKCLHINTNNMGSDDYRQLSSIMKRTFVNIVNTYQDKELSNIDMPTLLIWGSNDRDTPLWMGQKMNKHIKDSSLIVFEGRGHFAYLEEQMRFLKIIDSFVGGI